MIISISCLAAGSSGDSGPFSRRLDLAGIAGLQEWSVSQLEFEAKKEVGPPHCTSGSCFLSRFGCFQSAEQSTYYQNLHLLLLGCMWLREGLGILDIGKADIPSFERYFSTALFRKSL